MLASSATSLTPWSPNYPSRSKLWPMGPEIKIDLSKVEQVGGLWRWQSTRKITKFLIRVWIHSLWIWDTSIIFTDRILSPLLLLPLIMRSTRAQFDLRNWFWIFPTFSSPNDAATDQRWWEDQVQVRSLIAGTNVSRPTPISVAAAAAAASCQSASSLWSWSPLWWYIIFIITCVIDDHHGNVMLTNDHVRFCDAHLDKGVKDGTAVTCRNFLFARFSWHYLDFSWYFSW